MSRRDDERWKNRPLYEVKVLEKGTLKPTGKRKTKMTSDYKQKLKKRPKKYEKGQWVPKVVYNKLKKQCNVRCAQLAADLSVAIEYLSDFLSGDMEDDQFVHSFISEAIRKHQGEPGMTWDWTPEDYCLPGR